MLAKHGVSDGAVSAIARAALQVAPPLSVLGVLSRVTADDETEWIDFALALDGQSVEQVTKLNQKLAERLAELSLDRRSVEPVPPSSCASSKSSADACNAH